MPPQTTATHKIRCSVGRRAELLADSIEEGPAGLAAFAEGLSETEWLVWRHRAPCCQYVPDRD
jgi:hypothetical protein